MKLRRNLKAIKLNRTLLNTRIREKEMTLWRERIAEKKKRVRAEKLTIKLEVLGISLEPLFNHQ